MTSSHTVSEFFSQLIEDSWRDERPFSTDIEDVHRKVFVEPSRPDFIADILGEWFQRFQPCLFGRLAARSNLLSYCILTESDLLSSDDAIGEKIQGSRTQWTEKAFKGEKSGFILYVMSQKIARALPNHSMEALGKRLCSLYLLQDVLIDTIHLEEIFLEKPGSSRKTWKWDAGVNYFCAQGDRRWWHDHRIPGGMAFSVNSVGHLVKSAVIGKAMIELDKSLDVVGDNWIPSRIDSLGTALEFAMRTIDLASDAISGRATWLLPLPADEREVGHGCPVDLPPKLKEKDFRRYSGYYHTDFTLPGEYFVPDVRRPTNIPQRALDLSYLFDNSIDNPDYVRMGTGRLVRSDAGVDTRREVARKRMKASAEEVDLADNERLIKALKNL